MLGGERLQPSVGTHLPLGQLGHTSPQDLGRSDVGDALPPLVASGAVISVSMPMTRPVTSSTTGPPRSPVVRSLAAVSCSCAPAVRARQQIAGHPEAEVPLGRGLGGKPERAHLMPPAPLRRPQRHDPHPADMLLSRMKATSSSSAARHSSTSTSPSTTAAPRACTKATLTRPPGPLPPPPSQHARK